MKGKRMVSCLVEKKDRKKGMMMADKWVCWWVEMKEELMVDYLDNY